MNTRRIATRLLCSMIWALGPFAGSAIAQTPGSYAFQTPPLDTPWTQQVLDALDNGQPPRCEYPRPQLVRPAVEAPEWMCLNGVWEYSKAPIQALLPAVTERVLVPFPVESGLSGIQRELERTFFYRRSFTVPAAWAQDRVLLHFEGVDYTATVLVNNTLVGSHSGAFDAFSFDITDALVDGENTLVVQVTDPGNFGGGQPVGKQQEGTPLTVVFNPISGIWQPVWLEPVPAASISKLDLIPDLETSELRVTPTIRGAGNGQLRLTARTGDAVVGTVTGSANSTLTVPVPEPRLWSPDDPHLYDLTAELLDNGGAVIDTVDSYFGMRSVGLAQVGGVTRIVLNGEFVFQSGILDQGYWPDGLYTAPTDEAMVFDLELTRQLGFNTSRKHVKVEPRRWYHHADRLGVLVWQDMPNMTIYRPVTTDAQANFERETLAMVDQFISHPSIVMWMPWNEAWGQSANDSQAVIEGVVAQVRAADPSRVVTGHSGAANCCQAYPADSSQVLDTHLYSGPYAPPPDDRASIVGEFGVCQGRNPDNEWAPNDPLSGGDRSQAAQDGHVARQFDALTQAMRTPGLSGAVYVELYDIERETAGFITYDRRIEKCSWDNVRALNETLIAASRLPGNLLPQAAALPAGQSAYWPLDEGTGVAAANAVDGNDLALVDGPTWVQGVSGQALAFTGGGEHAVSASPVLDTSQSFTVAAWLRHADTGQSASALSQNAAGQAGFQMGLLNSDGRPDLAPAYATFPPAPGEFPPWRWTFSVPGASGDLAAGGPGTNANSSYGDGSSYTALDLKPPVGQWQHVIGVVDKINRTISVYYNGEHISSEPADYNWTSTALFALGIGAADNPDGDSFNGAADEVRVWPRALSSAEAWQLFAFETAGGVPPAAAPATPAPGPSAQSSAGGGGGALGWSALMTLLLAAGVRRTSAGRGRNTRRRRDGAKPWYATAAVCAAAALGLMLAAIVISA